MDTTVLILNSAYLVLVASTFTRTFLTLRLALMAGAVGFVVYGALAGNVTVVIWNAITGLLHAIHAHRYISARRAVELTEADEAWRERLFPDLDRFDFYSLWSLGEELTFEGETIVSEGQHHEKLSLILSGAVVISRGNETIARLGEAALVGEMSYVSGDAASADAVADGVVVLREWDQSRLRALDNLNPRAGRALSDLVQRDLAGKVG